MFHRVLHTLGIFQKISYTLWNMSLILSHPPSLLGQCPKFDRIFFLMASLRLYGYRMIMIINAVLLQLEFLRAGMSALTFIMKRGS